MSQGELPDSIEARLLLVDFFCQLQKEVMRKFGVTPGVLINFARKTQDVMPAREHVVSKLRQRVFQHGIGKKAQLAIGGIGADVNDLIAAGWEPVSYPILAKLLDVDHATLIAIMRRIAAREAKDVQSQNSTSQ